jgi:TPR repeat protein
MYNHGRGVPRDHAAAAAWYLKAADQGDTASQVKLGIFYGTGQGVSPDPAAAASWFRKAADQGEAAGQYNLGIMYASGKGVPLDYVQAHKWFSLASLRYDASDKESREDAAKNRDMVATKMTPVQIAEAQKLARGWKPKADGSRP